MYSVDHKFCEVFEQRFFRDGAHPRDCDVFTLEGLKVEIQIDLFLIVLDLLELVVI